MTWTADEEKRFRALQEQVAALTRRVTDNESGAAKRDDQRMHEFRTMLTSAQVILSNSAKGQIDSLRAELVPLLDAAHGMVSTLAAVRAEMAQLADERRAHEAEKHALAQIEAAGEVARTRRLADRDHRIKVYAILGSLIAAVAAALAVMLRSRVQ